MRTLGPKESGLLDLTWIGEWNKALLIKVWTSLPSRLVLKS